MFKLLKRNKSRISPVSILFTSLKVLFLMIFSYCSFAGAPPPSIKQCKSKWVLTNITPGMQFGDFTIDSGSGTITLNGGAARTGGGLVNLVTAGSAVNSHQISITNRKDPEVCATYGITIDWNIDPTITPMTGNGNDITMSNVLVDIPGEPGTPFTVANLPYSFVPATLPVVIEITSQMNVAAPQINGVYTSAPYEIAVIQSAHVNRGTGIADTFAITPLTLTPGVNMDFGMVASGSTGGMIVLNEVSGARTVASGDADVVSNAASGTPGTFTIQGNAGLSFNVSYVDGTLTDPSGANAMTISNFTDTTATLTLTGGLDAFSVGATLQLNPYQPAGNYSTANPGGTPYSITVNYN
jgi:hypothetical protein